jgi:rhodanese-related sulfurtransferase/DNA-binding transcriptional ArsR family regulator
MSHREFKDALYTQFARIGHALSSPKRIELLDLLSQGEKGVEQLAEHASTPVKNTSAHLRVLRQARLVETRKRGTHVLYRLADGDVDRFLRAFQALSQDRLAEVERVTKLFLHSQDTLEPVTRVELQRRLKDGSATIIDVRPRDEFEAGHIPGAVSMPVDEVQRRMRELPKSREVIAYCRGPYCLYSLDAVTLLRKHGYRARRADEGMPDWRASGFPVALGVESRSVSNASRGHTRALNRSGSAR